MIIISQSEINAQKIINQKTAYLFAEGALGLDLIPDEGHYNALLLGGGYSFPLYKAKKNFNISLDIIPHVGIGKASNYEFEYGLNAQAGFNFQLNEQSVLSFMLGTGPHYFSFNSVKQVNGFVFSDNASLVYKRLLKNKNHIIGFKAGVRHISNLSIKNPNGGINSVNLGILIGRLR